MATSAPKVTTASSTEVPKKKLERRVANWPNCLKLVAKYAASSTRPATALAAVSATEPEVKNRVKGLDSRNSSPSAPRIFPILEVLMAKPSAAPPPCGG
jgi:hypothetical protein